MLSLQFPMIHVNTTPLPQFGVEQVHDNYITGSRSGQKFIESLQILLLTTESLCKILGLLTVGQSFCRSNNIKQLLKRNVTNVKVALNVNLTRNAPM